MARVMKKLHKIIYKNEILLFTCHYSKVSHTHVITINKLRLYWVISGINLKLVVCIHQNIYERLHLGGVLGSALKTFISLLTLSFFNHNMTLTGLLTFIFGF